ncbi:hypothetical protein B0H19DRAFT_709108 [Mycena capillaripes]|nr:hypothetical protein B0H19DRAFT_709108 [Mycena capillaripes]
MVSLWDIDLQHEIHLDTSTGLVNRHRMQPTVRRMYSAKIKGQTTTVAMYQGRGAEEEWRQELANHPNIIQIRGAASSGSIHATLFHDDLIPLEQYMNFYRHSHLLTVYIYACCDEEFWDIIKYFVTNFQRELAEEDCTFWIRRSTGHLCADLTKPNTVTYFYETGIQAKTQRVSSWNAPNGEAMIIENLTLRNYHAICAFHLDRYRSTIISTPVQVNLGKVVFWPATNRFGDSVGIAFSHNAQASPRQWEATGGALGKRTEKGWTRFSTSDVFDSTLTLMCSSWNYESWLTQANHIFSCLHMSSNFEDCGTSPVLCCYLYRNIFKFSWTMLISKSKSYQLQMNPPQVFYSSA